MTRKEHRYVIGKVDYNNSGRRNCKAVITWTLRDGVFSMCGEIWNPCETDIYPGGGQCVDTVAAFFPHNKKVQRMLEVWRRYHLNNMKAGSPAQQRWLNDHEASAPLTDHYGWASAALSEAGLNPDPEYLHNGEPYRYGSAWLREEIPQEIVAEIESW